MICDYPVVLNLNQLFLKLNRWLVLPVPCEGSAYNIMNGSAVENKIFVMEFLRKWSSKQWLQTASNNRGQ